jgi:hypothetical protein
MVHPRLTELFSHPVHRLLTGQKKGGKEKEKRKH